MRTYFCLISCWCLWLLCLPEAAHSSAGRGRSLHSVSPATAAPMLSYTLSADSSREGRKPLMRGYGQDRAKTMGSIATIIFFGAAILPFFLYFGFFVSSRKLWQELHAYEHGDLLANEAD